MKLLYFSRNECPSSCLMSTYPTIDCQKWRTNYVMTDFGYITDPSLNCLSFTQAFRCSTRHRLLIFHNSKDTGYFISKFFMQFLVHLLLDSTLLTKELIYEAKWTSHLCSSRFDVSKYLTTGRYFYKVRVFFCYVKTRFTLVTNV